MKTLETRNISEFVREKLHDTYLTREDGSLNEEEVNSRTLIIVRKILKLENFRYVLLSSKEVFESLASAFTEEGIQGEIEDNIISFPDETIKVGFGKKSRIILEFSTLGEDTLKVSMCKIEELRLIPRLVKTVHSVILDMVTPERIKEENRQRALRQIALQRMELEKLRYKELERFRQRIESELNVDCNTSNEDVYAMEMTARILKESFLNESEVDLDMTKADHILEHCISEMYSRHLENIFRDTRRKIKEEITANRYPIQVRKQFLEKIGPILTRKAPYYSNKLEEQWKSLLEETRRKISYNRKRYFSYMKFDKKMSQDNSVLDTLVQRGWRFEIRPGNNYRQEHGVLLMKTGGGQTISFISKGREVYHIVLTQAIHLIPALDKLEQFCERFKVIIAEPSDRHINESLTENLNQRFSQSHFRIDAFATSRKRELFYHRMDGTIFYAKIRPECREAEEIAKAIEEFAKLDTEFLNDHPSAGSISFNIKPAGEMYTTKESITPEFEA